MSHSNLLSEYIYAGIVNGAIGCVLGALTIVPVLLVMSQLTLQGETAVPLMDLSSTS